MQNEKFLVDTSLIYVYGINIATYLSFLLHKKEKEGNNFLFSREEFLEITRTSLYVQGNIINYLKNNNIISIKRKGVPPRAYVTINEDAITRHVKSAFNCQTGNKHEKSKRSE